MRQLLRRRRVLRRRRASQGIRHTGLRRAASSTRSAATDQRCGRPGRTRWAIVLDPGVIACRQPAQVREAARAARLIQVPCEQRSLQRRGAGRARRCAWRATRRCLCRALLLEPAETVCTHSTAFRRQDECCGTGAAQEDRPSFMARAAIVRLAGPLPRQRAFRWRTPPCATRFGRTVGPHGPDGARQHFGQLRFAVPQPSPEAAGSGCAHGAGHCWPAGCPETMPWSRARRSGLPAPSRAFVRWPNERPSTLPHTDAASQRPALPRAADVACEWPSSAAVNGRRGSAPALPPAHGVPVDVVDGVGRSCRLSGALTCPVHGPQGFTTRGALGRQHATWP